MAAPRRVRRDKVNKLVFLAQLHMDKGLAEALEACRHLPDGCHLDVFGPCMSDTDLSGFKGHPRATYGGAVGRRSRAGRARGERAAIERLLADPELYQRLCKGAKRRGDRFRRPSGTTAWLRTCAACA